jgi:hypothetical protein
MEDNDFKLDNEVCFRNAVWTITDKGWRTEAGSTLVAHFFLFYSRA